MTTILYLLLALLCLFVAPLNGFRHPGGPNPITFVPIIVGLFGLLASLAFYADAKGAERIARLVCAGASALAICLPTLAIIGDQMNKR